METRRLCEKSCSERSWCGGLGVCGPSLLFGEPIRSSDFFPILQAPATPSSTRSHKANCLTGSSGPANWPGPWLGAAFSRTAGLREVGRRIVTATQVPQVASFGKASCSVSSIISLTS